MLREKKKKIVKIEEKGLQGSRAENSYPNNNTMKRLEEDPDCNYPLPREKGGGSVEPGVRDRDLVGSTPWRQSWPREAVSTLFPRAGRHMREPSQACRPWLTTGVSPHMPWSFVPRRHN